MHTASIEKVPVASPGGKTTFNRRSPAIRRV